MAIQPKKPFRSEKIFSPIVEVLKLKKLLIEYQIVKRKVPMKLSVVVCVYNEELNVKPLVQQISDALQGYDYEIIYVDDGSTDNTVKNLKAIPHPNLKVVEFRKNYGQSLALMAGIDYATGDFIITMDGDLQNDPSDIPMMLKTLQEGDWDLVVGLRKKRQDGMFLRKIPSKIANWIIRTSSGVKR